MAQMPRRVKHRKVQRGHIKGNATRGNRVVFGDFGLQALEPGWLKTQTIEAGRIAAQQYIRGTGKLYICLLYTSDAADEVADLLVLKKEFRKLSFRCVPATSPCLHDANAEGNRIYFLTHSALVRLKLFTATWRPKPPRLSTRLLLT